MKRLTDERIAALIDIAPLSKTIVDIKTALIELQERRKADAKPVISIIIKDGWPEENTAAPIHGSPKLTDGTHELYAAPPVPDEMTVEAAYPEVQTGWNDAKNYTSGWNACRAAMLNQTPVKQPANNPQWIKCSDRLPPEEYEPDGGAVFYLAWHKNESECGSQYSLTNVVFLRRHWENWYSHWMPLPPAPKPETEKSMKEHKEYLAKEAALAKIISTAGKDPSEITDAVWAAGYRKPERTEEEAINLAIDTFTDSRYYGIPEDVWPKTYDEILRCELNEIIEEELQCYFSDDIIANRLIKAGYSPENAND